MGVLEKRGVEYLLADLDGRTLTEEQQKLLDEAKNDYEDGLYQEALYKLWQASNTN